VADKRRVLIVGGGFAGINCATRLGNVDGVDVTLVDRRNHHLFQPLLYQVAMAGLSPADIAVPIRSLLSGYENVQVLQATVESFALTTKRVSTDAGELAYDTLVVGTGAQHAYFGNERWEPYAPGLKTLEQATEIRRRVLHAFEAAEVEADPKRRRALLTFVVIGGGPTGVELAGALGEMSRFTLSRDFRHIDPKLTRIILIEAGPRILPTFATRLSSRATRDLEQLGVQVWTETFVTDVATHGVQAGAEHIEARTVLWAAGVRASHLGAALGTKLDGQGRVVVGGDLTIPGHPEVFVAGDLAHFEQDGRVLPGVATVALQQGRYIARTIRGDVAGRPRSPFVYWDKGQMATIGRRRAVLESGPIRLTGFLAWVAWLLVHIYYLSGFRNRLLVLIQWAWSYFTFARGARLIVEKTWRSYDGEEGAIEERARKQSGSP
jgi:NADH dehydrogenase